jgi:hypothetical protein
VKTPRGYDTHVVTDYAADWIRQRLTTWHGIYGPLFEWRKESPDPRPEAVRDFENMVHAYWGTVLSIDSRTGRFVDLLEERGEFEDTIVVFMGRATRRGAPRGSTPTTTRSSFPTRPTSAASAPTDSSSCATRTATAAPTAIGPRCTTSRPTPRRPATAPPTRPTPRPAPTSSADLERRLAALLDAQGLGPGRDRMPIDEGIKPTLPDQRIR